MQHRSAADSAFLDCGGAIAEKRPFIEDAFSSDSIRKSGLFSEMPIQELWEKFKLGDDNREWSRVWSLAVLISFVNRSRPARHAGPR